jgi:hypothetical protein
MSLTILQTPEQFQPVLSNGLFFTVSADTTNTFKFRYVYDLYVNGVYTFEGKASPNPSGVAVLDLQQILENECFNNPISSWNGTPIYTHTTFPFSAPYLDETILYSLKIGYEYADSELGVISGFTGVGDIQGPPAFQTQNYKTFRSTMGVNGNATEQNFNINPFVLSGDPTTTNPTTSGLFLTNSPRTRAIQETEYYTLGFTNYYMGGNLLSEPYYAKFTFYDDQGNIITGTTYENITTNGGGPRTTCNEVYPAMYLINPPTETDFNTLYVGCGPMNIPNFPSNCAQYSVQLFGKFTGSTSPIQPTPTPTPTPSATSQTPTPTPTPTSTPSCNCKTWLVTNESGGSAPVNVVNCNTGQSQFFDLPNNTSTEVCSCIEPFSAVEITVVDGGSCYTPSPSPTPTPSSTPCSCGEYNVINEGINSPVLFYTFCNGQPITLFLSPGYDDLLCGCIGTFSCSDPNVVITYAGTC